MGRRRLVVLLSAITMLLICGGVVGGLVAATQSVGGREWIRGQLAKQVARAVNGRLHVGRISGSFLTDFAVDSLAIIGPDDSVFIATGPVHITYDPRDLIDGRIIVRSVELQHPFIVMRHENSGDVWNFNRIFPPSHGAVKELPPARSAFGAIIQLRNVRIRDLHFQLTQPWAPDDSLKGARRDSAIVRNLAATDQEIRAVGPKARLGYQKTLRWTEGNWTFNRVRFRQPDRPGMLFDIARFDVNEHSPPFAVRNMRGTVLWRNDSIWIDMRHLELPGSVASATGRIDWRVHPVRYNIHIHSDSVSLSDVGWISPAIPRKGIGSVDLQIVTDHDPRLMDYALTKMDIRTSASRLRGAMTFGVGGPVLIVKDVNLDLAPLDFAFFEAMNGGPLAQPWNGAFTGTMRARGGPVNHLQIDEARITYTDRNVAGATSEFVGRGEVDILSPANTKFHGFHVDLARFDLRTPQFLSPGFPRLNGILSGEATLDSLWTDIRFRDADIMHRDGDSTPPSHIKGDVRLTTGGDNVAFDVAVAVLPLSFTTLARADTALHIPIRGEFTGPLRMQGDLTDFSVTTDLVGDAGSIQLEGDFDAAKPGYRVGTRGSVTGLDLRRLFARPGAPGAAGTVLNGRFVTAVEFDSLPNLQGEAQFTLERSTIDDVRVYSGQAKMRFAAGAMLVDTLRIETAPGTLTARGGLGLSSARTDSLQFRLDVDSLGGLRRYLLKAKPKAPAPGDSAARAAVRADTGAVARAAALADSLAGSFTVTGAITGSVPHFALHARAEGSGVRVASTTARTVTATANIAMLPDSAVGALSVTFDTLHVGTLSYSRVTVRDTLMARDRQRVSIYAKSQADSARAAGELHLVGDTTAIHLDSLSIQTSADSWVLRRPAVVSIAKGAFAIDSLALTGKTGGMLAVSGLVTADSTVAFTVHSDSVPLADIGEMMQVLTPFQGTLSLNAEMKGSRQNPTMKFDGLLRHGLFLGLRLDELKADGSYADRKLTTSVVYSHLGLPAMHGTAVLPLDLALDPAGPRLVEAPLKASIHTDSSGMAVLEALSKSVTKASGSLTLNLDIAGTWQHPLLDGALVVHNGAMSMEQLGNAKLTAVEANIAFHGENIEGKISARSGKTKPATGELSGKLGIHDLSKPTYDLKFTAQSFNVIDRPKVATLDLTGNLGLVGSSDAATLTGSLTVDRGVVAIPELFAKHVISLDDPEFYRVVDTTAFEDRNLFPTPPNAIMNNLTVNNVTVTMGKEVWLRSSEANINLGGKVTVARGRSLKGSKAGRSALDLDGTLQTVRGTYRLSLGLVTRVFTVQNGDVRFFGDQDLNGALNVNAEYVVHQSSQSGARPDVHIGVHLGGTLLAPTATLSSADSTHGTQSQLTQADLVSYLATGQPSNQIGGPSGDYTATALNAGVSTAFSQVGTGWTGGVCDDFGVSTATLDAYQGGFRGSTGSILSGARANCARQLGEKVFLRLDYGLCQVGQLVGGSNGTSDPLTFADAIGVKVDYQLTTAYSLSGGVEPPTNAVLCTRDATARGFAPTPRQFGIDLFRLWRF